MRLAVLLLSLVLSGAAQAQGVPTQAEGLDEELIEVTIDQGVQRGVLSRRKGQDGPTRLIVLLPGYPSVVRPEMAGGIMSTSRLNGNFLVRARRHLNTEETQTLLADCHTAVGDVCTPAYQATRDRHRHIKALIEAARLKAPSIRQVYLVSTSAGSISSAFLAQHGPGDYAGVIHTAAIDLTTQRAYPQPRDFNYGASAIPQAFVHHADDPCQITLYSAIRQVAEKSKLPLVTVRGGSDFRGPACQAYTQHGFTGKEMVVMQHIVRMIVSGPPWQSSEL
jgi:hypothetical protein